MVTQEKARDLLGARARDAQGEELGTVDAIYVDDQTEKPEFAAVRVSDTGTALVPLARAEEQDGALRVAYPRDKVEGAPPAPTGEGLTQEEEAELYSYYGLDYTVTVTDADTIRLHRRAGDEEVAGSVEGRHEVHVEREPVRGETG